MVEWLRDAWGGVSRGLVRKSISISPYTGPKRGTVESGLHVLLRKRRPCWQWGSHPHLSLLPSQNNSQDKQFTSHLHWGLLSTKYALSMDLIHKTHTFASRVEIVSFLETNCSGLITTVPSRTSNVYRNHLSKTAFSPLYSTFHMFI